MSEANRRYTDEEFAMILRTASELANRAPDTRDPARGWALGEIQAAAAQAGLDPALIEQAARTLPVTPEDRSLAARLAGGPLRHHQGIHLAVPLDEAQAHRILSAVRIHAGPFASEQPGHASAHGVRWDASGSGDVLTVIARPHDGGTLVELAIDRRGTFTLFVVGTGSAMFLLVLVSLFGISQLATLLAIPTLVLGTGVVYGLARRFWSASTRAAQDTLAGLIRATREAGEPPTRSPRTLP